MPSSLSTARCRRLLAAALAAFVVCGLAALPASARTPVTIGIGNQDKSMFDSPRYQALGIKRVRYFIRWNAIKDLYQLRLADEFIDRAQRSGQEVFLHISTEDLRIKKGTLPSYDLYRRDVGRLVRRMRSMWGIKIWGTWNEVNHASQPTYRSAKRAASYFKAMYRVCKGCTIVALDVLDQKGVTKYMRTYYHALGSTYRKRAKIVGIHNYSDVNRKRSSGTRSIIHQARHYNHRTKFWLTETGGIVKFGKSFPCNSNRAKYRIRYMFGLAKNFKSYIQRLYAYAWSGADCKERFDAGLVTRHGTPRKGYYEFKRQLRHFRT